nr:glutamic acid-rich protein-like [Onthophagus taurus]
MPTSVHKILIHGSAVIKEALLPIGELSEEAQEANNKKIRKFRESHTRKCSRLDTNEDLFKRLLLSSHPFISNFQQHISRKHKKMSMETKRLLIIDNVEDQEEEKDREEEDEYDEEQESEQELYEAGCNEDEDDEEWSETEQEETHIVKQRR